MPAKTIILGSFAAATMFLTTAAVAAPTEVASVDAMQPTIGKTLVKTSRADNPAQRYCIESDVTGSRIPRRSCETLSNWQDQGIDPRLLPLRR